MVKSKSRAVALKASTPQVKKIASNAALLKILSKKSESDIIQKSDAVTILLEKKQLHPKMVAKLSQMSLAHVYNMHTINKWPDKVKHLVASEKINLSDALEQSRNQVSPNEFVKDVENFIKNKDKGQSIISEKRKEEKTQKLLEKKEAVIREKNFEKIKKLTLKLNSDLSSSKLNQIANMVIDKVFGREQLSR